VQFIEISNTVCVNTKEIAWVASDQEGLSSVIYVGGKEYPSDIPYKTLVSMLQGNDEGKTMEKLDKYLSVATITSL
jgi:hypothetical protein